MTRDDLAATYRDCIACLDRQDWPSLGDFVRDDVGHNGERGIWTAIDGCWRRMSGRSRT
ncbi:hypothetical protein Rumeso_04586 [Rubellimicrobium mesophilum DSM 19309]|uniref:SnoaL-like domain-containing protein n=1 Tax=Rubellimicrobium mesophilum DSM 19309 TaxID=442562 RepID=A0A017HHL9_9RHOB|nr:hypothetical protein [Rubellimicrobium mesophilum]EYD73851.1 hypothetical protein Rumeso_04586 [Rubellimicrobium mesophilum DSM 19309]